MSVPSKDIVFHEKDKVALVISVKIHNYHNHRDKAKLRKLEGQEGEHKTLFN